MSLLSENPVREATGAGLVVIGRPGDMQRCINDLRDVIRLRPRHAITNALVQALDTGDTRTLAKVLDAVEPSGGIHTLNAAFVDDRHDPLRYLVIQAVVLAVRGVSMVDVERVSHISVRRRLEQMIDVRRTRPSFHPSAVQEVLEMDPRLVAIRRTAVDGSEYTLCLHNVTDEVVTTWTGNDAYTDLINDAERGATIKLRPYEVAWLHQQVIDLRQGSAQADNITLHAATL